MFRKCHRICADYPSLGKLGLECLDTFFELRPGRSRGGLESLSLLSEREGYKIAREVTLYLGQEYRSLFLASLIGSSGRPTR